MSVYVMFNEGYLSAGPERTTKASGIAPSSMARCHT